MPVHEERNPLQHEFARRMLGCFNEPTKQQVEAIMTDTEDIIEKEKLVTDSILNPKKETWYDKMMGDVNMRRAYLMGRCVEMGLKERGHCVERATYLLCIITSISLTEIEVSLNDGLDTKRKYNIEAFMENYRIIQ